MIQKITKKRKQISYRPAIILFLIALCLGNAKHSYSQVSYNYGWEPTGLGSWDGSTGATAGSFTRSTTTPCTGSGAVRANAYYGSYSVLTSPNLGTSNGGAATLNYNYKVVEFSANTTGAAASVVLLEVQYGTTSSGPWTTVQTIDASNHVVSASCAAKTVTFPTTPGDFFVRFKCTALGSATDIRYYFDDIVVSQGAPPSCLPPTSFVVNNLTTTSGTLNWAAPASTTPIDYKWEVRSSGTPGTPGALASGTTTASTFQANVGSLTQGTAYTAYVMSDCSVTDASSWISTPFATRPSNDECVAAIGLTVNADLLCGATTAGSTVGGTQSNETVPTVGATGINDDVWFKFTATAAGHRIALSNVSGSTDMAMAIYSGTCGSLVHIKSSDPNSMDVTGLTVGQEYKVRVYTFSSTSNVYASFNICVGTIPPPPVNDECVNAIAFPTIPTDGTCVSVTANCEFGTPSTAACAGTADDDIWYSFVCPAGQTTILFENTTISGSGDRVIQFFSGTCGSLTSLLCSDPESGSVTGLTPGSTYYLRVYSYSDATATSVSVCLKTLPPPPANDNAVNAVSLTVNSDLSCAATTNGTTVMSTQSTDAAPSCSATGINDDVWYKFTALSSALQFKFTNVTSGTMAVALYTGTPGSLAGTTDCGSGATVNFADLIPGTQYYARMFTSTATSTTTTTFTVCLGTLPNMTFDSVTTTQASTAAVSPGSVNQQVLGILVYTNGGNNPLNATKFDFTTSGTMTAGEVTNAKVYYTGTSSTFATTTLFGSAVANPNGSFSIIGSQALSPGSSATANYFWLVYDISCSAVSGNTVDAICNGATVSSVLKTPTISDPSGSRTITATTTFNTVANGDWSSPSTWACGNIPTASSNVSINNTVTVSTSGNLAGNVTIAAGKTLTISSGSLTMGPVNGGNKTLSVLGTLTITGGTFNINGNVILGNGSTFNMSGGNMNIDPNDGTTGGSVASGTAILAVGTAGSDIITTNVTGGNILINDPAYAGTGYTIAMNTNTAQFWSAGNTIQFGGTTGTNSTTSTVGFKVDCYINSARLSFGNIIINGNAADRYVMDGTYGISANGDLTINAGSELRIVSTAFSSFAGNVTNNGTLTITGTFRLESPNANASATLIPSTKAQVVSGTGIYRNATSSPTANFTNMAVNNTNAIGVTFADANSLLNGANTGTVASTLTMIAGKINVGANTLILGTSTSSTGTYTYTAGMVIGSFKRWLGNSTGARAFDIGMGNVGRKVSIDFTTAPTTGGSLTAKWNSGAPGSAGLPLTEGSNTYTNTSENGYWTVSAGDGLAGGTYTVAMTLTGGSDAPDYSTVTIGKRTTSADPWALVGTAVAPTGSASNFTVSRTGVTGFSDFTLLLTTTPLSVKLSSFTGRNAGAVNVLNWATAAEKDASHFDVLRSDDGNRFEKLTTVDAKNVMTGSKYEFTDTKPFEGKNFYRLNMVDVNGKSAYSDVVVLSVKSSAGLSLVASPNPVNQTLKVSINGKIGGKATIQVVDITGKIVQKIQVSSNDTDIDMSTLSSGTYMIKYNDNSSSSVIKVIKN